MRDDHRLYAPATARNRDAILEVFTRFGPRQGTLLEISSGSGEHAVHMARALPDLIWQPSDIDDAHLASIEGHRQAEGLENILEPAHLDVTRTPWPLEQADAIFNANMIHIAPWDCTLGLMQGAGQVLKEDGQLIMYGPYLRNGIETAPSNLSFDHSLRQRNPSWGIRSLEEVVSIAEQNHLALEQVIEMPANNLMVLYRKSA